MPKPKQTTVNPLEAVLILVIIAYLAITAWLNSGGG